jgi:uncharacterized phage-associated protein
MPTDIKFNEQKSTEAASLLLYLKGGRSDFWWIIKMLYLVDREAYRRWERPITYDYYRSLQYGPVVMSIYNIIKKNIPSPFWKQFIVTLPKESGVMLNGTPAPIKKLSKAEVDLINSVFQEKGALDGDQLVEFTHTLPEWKDPRKTGSTSPINISDLLGVLDYSSEEVNRIEFELKQEESLDAILGA